MELIDFAVFILDNLTVDRVQVHWRVHDMIVVWHFLSLGVHRYPKWLGGLMCF